MAHTERTRGDNRPHPALYNIGDTVGMMTTDGFVEGQIHSKDAGGWIYVGWKRPGLPGYLRSTHVVLVRRKGEANVTN